MKFADYLLLRTPPSRMADSGTGAPPGQVPVRRVVLSIVGLLVGVVLSFVVTGIRPATGTPPTPVPTTTGDAASTPATDSREPVVIDLSWNRFVRVFLISLVICGLTYQQLYFSLKLYQGEPTFLILFVSFQYGYFWQSIVQGASSLV